MLHLSAFKNTLFPCNKCLRANYKTLTIFLVIANSSKDSIFPTISLEIESLIRPQNRPTETMCKKRKTNFCKASNTIAKLSWTRNELQICKTKNLWDTCSDFIFCKIGQRISLISRLAKSRLTQLHPQLQKSLKQGTNYKLPKIKDKSSLEIESPGLKQKWFHFSQNRTKDISDK